MRPSSPAVLATLAFAVAPFSVGAAPLPAGLMEQPEVVAFVGHARPTRESFGALGRFNLGLVCRADLSCAVFLFSEAGEVDQKRTAALREAIDALPASCVGPESSLSAVASEVGQVIGNPLSSRTPPNQLCLVRLDARGEPQLVGVPVPPALVPPILGDAPPAVTLFKRGPQYREFLGPARVEPELAALAGGRWVLALVTAPSSLSLSGCGQRRVFVFDTTTRAVDSAQTKLLGNALEQALGGVGVGCARSLYPAGPSAFILSWEGGKHGREAGAEIRLAREGTLPLQVRRVAADALPPRP